MSTSRLSTKQIVDLVETTNENCQRIGLPVKYKHSEDTDTHRIMNNNNMIVCSGTLKDCDSFLRGINSIINDSYHTIKTFIISGLNINKATRKDAKELIATFRKELKSLPEIKQ